MAFIAIEAVVIIGVVAWQLGLASYDMSVPFSYAFDTLWNLALIKGLLDNGWTFHVPQLSAPFGLDALAFPAMTTVDWALMKLIGITAPHPGTVLNVFWILSLVLCAWSATLALRLLAVELWLAAIGGIAYALCPYAFFRNTAHISLVFYAVPLIGSLAVHLATGAKHSSDASSLRRWGYVATLLQSFSYVYYTSFAVALYLIATVIGFARTKNLKLVKTGGIAVSIALLGTAINLSPSIYIWSKYGKPPDTDYKQPAEAETYALRIRRMLAPHALNPIAPLAAWGKLDAEAGFTSGVQYNHPRLGLLASAGFVLSLWVLVRGRRPRPQLAPATLQPISALALVTFLICTFGGFGAIFNTLITSNIRDYSRFSVYLSFFSLAVLFVWLTKRINRERSSKVKVLIVLVVVAFISLSVFDQLLDIEPLRHRQAADQSQANMERSAVHVLQHTIPAGSIFQLPLPVYGFPLDMPRHRMGTYDHARPYLWSQGLSWSWPSFSLRHHAWVSTVESLTAARLIDALSLSGFSAIWIDRYGYEDGGNQLISDLSEAGAVRVNLPGERYAALDVRQYRQRLHETLGSSLFEAAARKLLQPVTYAWQDGFYFEERTRDGQRFRWAQKRAKLVLANFDSTPASACLTFDLQSYGDGTVFVYYGGKQLTLQSSLTAVPAAIQVQLEAGQSLTLDFFAQTPKVNIKGVNRSLFFNVSNFNLSVLPSNSEDSRPCR